MKEQEITNAEMRLASQLLDLAENQFCNHGCNDFLIDDTPENRLIVLRMQYLDGDESDDIQIHEGKILTRDDLLMGYLSRRLNEHAIIGT